MSTVVNTQENNPNMLRAISSSVVATGVGLGSMYGLEKLRKPVVNSLMNTAFDNAAIRNDIFKEAAFKSLKSEGIRYANLAEDSFMAMIPLFSDDELDMKNFIKSQKSFPSKAEDFLKNFKAKITPKFIQKMHEDKSWKNITEGIEDASKGRNAATLFDKVCVNFDEVAVASFHEAGHAKNYMSKNLLTKSIKYLSHPFFKKVGLGIAFASAILIPSNKTSDSESAENQGLGAKTLDFFKKNCIGIAALAVAPEILEEGLASINGYKMAKKVLSANELKTLNSVNAKAWLSYVLKGAVAIASIWTAKKAKETLES